MTAVRLRTVDAFTERPFTGNPAAVLVLDRAPSDEWTAAVARETNLSDTGDGYDFVSRVFAPQAGIPEDPVTGSAHTVLAPY